MARLSILLAASLMLAAPQAHAATAQFKGLSVISKELTARIASDEDPIELDRYMPADGLDDLVGTWAAFGTEHKFQNGQPNAVNMVLLRLAFAGFARSLATSCTSPQLLLNDAFFDMLEVLCSWPADQAKSEQVLTTFWLGLMGYNAPESEFAIWRDFVIGTYGKKKASEAIEGMTLALMLNPYFLLEQ
jgi:hypothetical protein